MTLFIHYYVLGVASGPGCLYVLFGSHAPAPRPAPCEGPQAESDPPHHPQAEELLEPTS